MANMPQYLTDLLLNWIKHTDFAAKPTTLYLGLFTTASTQGTAGTEAAAGSYDRVGITGASGWAAISTVNGARQISNSGDIVFTTASADWGTVVGWELRDASTAGNRVAFGAFDEPFVVLNGQTAKVLAGALVIAVS